MIRRFSNSTPTARLALEALESRFVPANATLRWFFNNPNNNNWSDAANWQVQGMGGAWGPAAAAPDATDTAIFFNGQPRDVSVNVTTVGKIEIQAGYTGALTLPNNVDAKLLVMNGGAIKSSGNTRYVLELQGATSTITAGTLDKIWLRVGNSDPNATAGSALTINGDITLQNNAVIYIRTPVSNIVTNDVNWQGGNILTSGTTPDSVLYVSPGATLRINSSGQLGDVNTTSTTRLVNVGKLEVYSAPTIAGSFENAATTSIRSGANLKIQGTAKQTTGTTELQSGTFTMTANTGTYNVEGGSLIGNGTIAANLTLGTVANGAVSISPGYAGAEIGTLTITKSMHMISSATSTTIQVFADATFDKIVVQSGYAILNGTLTASVPQDYKKALGTSYMFLTAPTFTPGGGAPTSFTQVAPIGGQGVWMDGGTRVWKVKKDSDTGYKIYVGDSMS